MPANCDKTRKYPKKNAGAGKNSEEDWQIGFVIRK